MRATRRAAARSAAMRGSSGSGGWRSRRRLPAGRRAPAIGRACRPRLRFQAPRPTMPQKISPVAGSATTPSTGAAILDQADVDGEIVAPGGEFARAVQRVDQPEAAPGIGAWRGRPRSPPRRPPGCPGSAARRPSTISASAMRSASVTGEWSRLRSTAKPAARTAMIAAAASAREARGKREQGFVVHGAVCDPARRRRRAKPGRVGGACPAVMHTLPTDLQRKPPPCPTSPS